MGRVSSKRKLKQCDPFFKGKRENGKKAKAFDLPPVESKRSKKRQRKAVDEVAIEQFILRSSAIEGSSSSHGVKKTKKLDAVGSIRENETMKEFNKRINKEVVRVIYEETKKNKRKSEKRKEFLGKKKEKERVKKLTDQERYQEEYQATGLVNKDTFDEGEKVRFGERVDAPPVLPKLKGIFLKRANALEAKKAKK